MSACMECILFETCENRAGYDFAPGKSRICKCGAIIPSGAKNCHKCNKTEPAASPAKAKR